MHPVLYCTSRRLNSITLCDNSTVTAYKNGMATTYHISYLHLFIIESLRENCERQSALQSVQATITSFSLYAVICRLKSYKFSFDASMESPELTCQVPSPVSECSDVSVTIPRKSLREDVELTMKVREHYWEFKTFFVSLMLYKGPLITYT